MLFVDPGALSVGAAGCHFLRSIAELPSRRADPDQARWQNGPHRVGRRDVERGGVEFRLFSGNGVWLLMMRAGRSPIGLDINRIFR